jgi:hypothetical protein
MWRISTRRTTIRDCLLQVVCCGHFRVEDYLVKLLLTDEDFIYTDSTFPNRVELTRGFLRLNTYVLLIGIH